MVELGFLIVFAAGLLAIREYCYSLSSTASEYLEIHKLLCHIRTAVKVYAMPICKIAATVDLPMLECSGVINILKNSSIDVRWRERMKQCAFHIREDDKAILFDFFDAFGKSTAEEELLRIEKACEYFDKRQVTEQEACKRNSKIARILFCAGAVGALIVIM